MKIPWLLNGFRRNLSQKKLICLLILSVIFFPRESSELINSTPIENMDFLPQENCPLMIPKYFENVHPLGGHNFTLIAYKEKTSETNEKCIQTCCLDSNCSAVFMVMDNSTLKCYHVSIQILKFREITCQSLWWKMMSFHMEMNIQLKNSILLYT